MSEPTRDPRLLSAERLDLIRNNFACWFQHDSQQLANLAVQLLAHIAAQDERIALRDARIDAHEDQLLGAIDSISALKATVAAQDQRHAALVEALRIYADDRSWIEVPHAHSGLDWMWDRAEGPTTAAATALAALAQPPGDE